MKIIICDKKIEFDGAALIPEGSSVTANVSFDASWDDYPARVIIGFNPQTGALSSSLIRDGKAVIHTDGFKRLPRLEVFAFGVNKDGGCKSSGGAWLFFAAATPDRDTHGNIFGELCDEMEALHDALRE